MQLCDICSASKMHSVVRSYVLLLFLSSVGIALCSPSADNSDWKVLKQNAIGKWSKSRDSYGKEYAASLASSASSRSTKKNTKAHKLKKLNPIPFKKVGVEKVSRRLASGSAVSVARQGGGGGGGGGGGWGWGWPSHGGGGGGGSFDAYTIIAVSAFAALFGALMYELLVGSTRRSFDSSFNLPPISLGLDSEKLPEVMVKIGDWIANSAWLENVGNNSRTIRDIRDKVGIGKWFAAFKKDPVEYQCIRKLACETLASSSLAEKSLKTSLGSVFLTAFGNYIENGEGLQDLLKQIVGNPKKCDELVVGGYCEET